MNINSNKNKKWIEPETHSKMDKQTTGLKRNIIDKYYTSNTIVNKCIELIKKNIDIQDDDLLIEPSAGNGSFITMIKMITNNYLFYDLEPENSEIIKLDYLEFDSKTMIATDVNKIHLIGNPPFGRQSSMAIKFIKKSQEYCDSISFILPKSFKKPSLQKHFQLNFHLINEYDIPENSFIVDTQPYDVHCVFQIWVKKDTQRNVPEKLVPKKYSFVNKTDIPDISFRRVGVYAGKIDKETKEKSVQSHYFIKFDTIFTDELFDKLSQIKYDCKNNTVGPKSISKQELIKEFNKIM